MKNKSKLRCALIFGVLWAVTCLTAFLCNNRFDGALGDLRWYLCLYGPVLLLAEFMRGEEQEVQKTPRWAQALIFYLGTALVYLLFLWGINPLYLVWFWMVILMLVFAFIGFRLRLHPPKGCAAICGGSLFYGCYLLALIGMLLVLHPVSVDEIIRTGQAAGGQSGEYVGRLTSDTDAHPLGTYVFADSDNNYYYYDVVSGAFIKKQSIFDHLADIYE